MNPTVQNLTTNSNLLVTHIKKNSFGGSFFAKKYKLGDNLEFLSQIWYYMNILCEWDVV